MRPDVSAVTLLFTGDVLLLLSLRASSDELSDRIQAQQRQQQPDTQQGYMHQQQQQAEPDAFWAENGAAIRAADAERRQQRQMSPFDPLTSSLVNHTAVNAPCA